MSRHRLTIVLVTAALSGLFVAQGGAMALNPAQVQYANRIDDYLEKRGSPLAGHGTTFVAEGKKNGVNPALVVGISIIESGGGVAGPGPRIHNAWGWMTNSHRLMSFPSWDAGIAHVTKFIGQNYVRQGYLTIDRFANKYAPHGLEGNDSYRWASVVRSVVQRLSETTSTAYRNPFAKKRKPKKKPLVDGDDSILVTPESVKEKKQPIKKVSAWLLKKRKRTAIVEYAKWTCTKEPLIYYSQSRPKESIKQNYPKTKIPSSLDCSSHAIRCYQVAGAPSPSKYGYTGYGSTWDMEPRGQRIPLDKLIPSDLVYYNGHVVVYIGDGKVVSHGQQSGPRIYPLRYRSDIHQWGRRYF